LDLSATEKRLNIIYAGKQMLERCCKGAHSSIRNYFKGFPNVRIYADQKVIDTRKDCLVTDQVWHHERLVQHHGTVFDLNLCWATLQGQCIPTDVAYCCVGFVPNTDFLQANFASMLSPKGHIKVNEHLQVRTRCARVCVLFSPCPVFASHVILSTHVQAVDYPNIFALGDVADINEEKLAQVCECRSRCGEQQQQG
jgi:hypothetical protein